VRLVARDLVMEFRGQARSQMEFGNEGTPMTTRQLIEQAFADVPYPGDDNIADHQDCPECDDVRAFFGASLGGS